MNVRRLFSGLPTPRVFATCAAIVCALAITPAFAGGQQYEPLSAAMQTALAAAIAEQRSAPEPSFVSVAEKVDWLAQMADRLPRRWKPEYQQRIEFLKTVRYEAQRAGLDPQMVLGLIEVESYFRKYAVSSAGARGYMQVMPFWTGIIGDGDTSKLFDMRTNIRYGCVILRHYLDMERGDLFRALGRYNGSTGRPEYPNAVLAAWKKWSFDDRGSTQMARGASPPQAPAASVPAASAPMTSAPVTTGTVTVPAPTAIAAQARVQLPASR